MLLNYPGTTYAELVERIVLAAREQNLTMPTMIFQTHPGLLHLSLDSIADADSWGDWFEVPRKPAVIVTESYRLQSKYVTYGHDWMIQIFGKEKTGS